MAADSERFPGGSTAPAPTLGEAAPEFAKAVQAALRDKGADALADQIPGLQVAAFCTCAPRCSAFRSIADDRRPPGKVTTNFVTNTAATGLALVEAIGDVVVGLDILDDGHLRMASRASQDGPERLTTSLNEWSEMFRYRRRP